MAALAEIDLETLTPEQREAAVQAIMALETLRTENEVLTDRNEAQAERIRRLEHLVRELQRVIYRKRSEKLTPDERQLAFEDLVAAAEEIEEAIAPVTSASARSAKRSRPARVGDGRNVRIFAEVLLHATYQMLSWALGAAGKWCGSARIAASALTSCRRSCV